MRHPWSGRHIHFNRLVDILSALSVIHCIISFSLIVTPNPLSPFFFSFPILQVRRAVAQQIGAFARVVEPNFVKTELMPAFLFLVADDQDSVRLLTVDDCISIGRAILAEDKVDHLWSFSIQYPVHALIPC